MRRLSTPPYCRLETTIPVRYKTYDKRMRLVTVRAIYKFDSFWHPARDLRQLLTESREELTSRLGLGKVDPKKGTVGGVPVRMVPTTTYPEDHLTAAELKAPEGYRYWKVLPDGKTVRLLSIWDHEQEHVDKRDRLGRKIANDERYLKPVEVPLPRGWKVVQPFSGFMPDRNKRVLVTPEQAQAKLSGYLDGSTSSQIEELFGWPSQEELVPLVFKRRASAHKDAKYWEVTGTKFEHSERVLYRLLHYYSPLKISDFYKGHLLRLHHPKGTAFADLGIWKCEIDIRLYVDKAVCTQLKPAAVVRGGWAGAQKGEVACPAAMTAWCELLVKLLQTKTMIYSGNNFEV